MHKTIHLLVLLVFNPIFVLAQVDYDSEIQPIFDSNCVSCHGGQNGVTLSSYDAVMNSVGNQYGTNIVTPGEPNNSPIVDKIEPNPQFGVRMPQGGPYLSNEQIDLIRTWIEEGANEIPTSTEIVTDLPDGYSLAGNYPNPFNPTTTIQFEVPEAVNYSIQIYSAGGMLTYEINGMTTSGTVSTSIDFRNMPSGVYFYKVKVRSGTTNYMLGTGRMSLIK